MNKPSELWAVCLGIFAKIGIGHQINYAQLQEELRLNGVRYNYGDLELMLSGLRIDGRIEDNGGSWNEYTFFKNLNIERSDSFISINPKKEVDDLKNLDFPNGRVSE